MSPKIVGFDVWHVPVRLRRGHVMSFGTAVTADLIVVRAAADDGTSGWGEVTLLGGPHWSEESAESVVATLTRYLLPALVGRAIHAVCGLVDAHAGIRRNRFAKAAVDIALADLRARVLGIPLGALWGGHRPEPVPLSWSLAGGTVEQDIAEAAERQAAGIGIFKIKAGALPLRAELARITAIREALGPDVSLRIDANQGWTRAQAGSALPVLEQLDIAFVEQPVAADDMAGMTALQAATRIPIAADESLQTLADATTLANSDAARVFVYKPAKHGSLEQARHVAAVAESSGIEGYLGCMIESSIGTAAYLAFAGSGVSLSYGCELFGPQLLVDDLVHVGVRYERGTVLPPSGPGLGIEVDADKVRALARTHHHVTGTSFD
ncbi:enolase C-terminal domain-like protein [Saccharopolyspora phatthalungensis]|uniref:Muconate/chloromuconate cycloisomerase n=1 Tax=Saccharopolyspora phatthalungensis TaxID=664693 RepID=A0A840QID5_9PSEU|nr:enolase C-terminal domain-like protein [Saccharopolyspora phatthalungensis]MBB5158618.1 muconate/chloromuconate cycloisomerase [Saccharopolyspora phatthalungensis]